jgi:FimV-like protein
VCGAIAVSFYISRRKQKRKSWLGGSVKQDPLFTQEPPLKSQPASEPSVDFDPISLLQPAVEPVTTSSSEDFSLKLNLARAYVAMQEWDGAESLIKDILMGGNEHQQREAQRLQQELPAI